MNHRPCCAPGPEQGALPRAVSPQALRSAGWAVSLLDLASVDHFDIIEKLSEDTYILTQVRSPRPLQPASFAVPSTAQPRGPGGRLVVMGSAGLLHGAWLSPAGLGKGDCSPGSGAVGPGTVHSIWFLIPDHSEHDCKSLMARWEQTGDGNHSAVQEMETTASAPCSAPPLFQPAGSPLVALGGCCPRHPSVRALWGRCASSAPPSLPPGRGACRRRVAVTPLPLPVLMFPHRGVPVLWGCPWGWASCGAQGCRPAGRLAG